jgi:YD repeat-containing protein
MKKIYLSSILLFCTIFTFAQKSPEPPLAKPIFVKYVKKDSLKKSPSAIGVLDNTVPQLIPATPEAASLGKYGNVPVSYYTGVPSVSIPLQSIVQKDIGFDLGLSYHTGGIKVEEVAPWTGLGWSLTGLGTITKTVRGNKSDEKVNGYNNGTDNLNQIYDWYLSNSNDADVSNFCYNVADNPSVALDVEADLHTFQFGKYSGKFFFNRNDGNYYTIPRQNLKLEHANDYSSWTITTEDGTKYVFATSEKPTSSLNNCTGVDPYVDNDVTTSWLLTKIISPTDASNTIDISYLPENYTLKTIGGASKKNYLYSILEGCPCSVSNSSTNCITETNYSSAKINEITFRNGKIKFNRQATNRCDLSAKALDNITVYDADNNVVKKMKMAYSYFGYTNTTISNCGQSSFLGRLRLDSVQISGTGTLAMPPYKFAYQNDNIPPSRLSYEQDFWGFYNGASGNQDLIPDYFYPNNGSYFYLSGADRRTNHNFSSICQLQEITYPTGGKTIFEFEGNKASSPTTASSCDPTRCIAENTINQSRSVVFNSSNLSFNTIAFALNQPVSCLNRCQGGALVTLVAQGDALGTGFNQVQFRLNSFTGNVSTITAPSTGSLIIPNGSYTLTAIYNGGFTPAEIALLENTYIQISWQEMNNINDRSISIGGLRVKKITDIDQNGTNHIRKFDYVLEGSNESSGIVGSIPQNTYLGLLPPSSQSGPCNISTCVGAFRSGESTYPLITTQGANVGYTRVVVSDGESAENGKSVYTYTPVITHIPPNETPPVPPFMVEWTEGLPTKTSQWNTLNKIVSQDSSTYLTPDITNTYPPTSLYIETPNIKVHKLATFDLGSSTFTYYSMNRYFTPTDWLYQNFSQERTYHSDNVNYTKHEKFVEQNAINFMPSMIKEVNSVGDTLKTILKYPHDFQIDSTVYAGMVGIHQIAPVILQEEYIRKMGATSYNFLAKKLNLYAQFYSSFYAPNKVLTQENGGLLTQRMKVEYAPDALISSYTERNGIKTAFTWFGATDVGKRDLLKSMVKGDGSTIAQTTSYDYKPLVGMISQTDPRGLTSTFEYDALNRLQTVKDSEGKIVKNYTYQYASDAPSGGGSCTTPAPVITSVPASTGCNSVLSASTCTGGTINWSSGQTGTSITVPSVASPVYTATCTTTCASPASNGLAGLNLPSGWTPTEVGATLNGCLLVGTNQVTMRSNPTTNGIGGSTVDNHYFYQKTYSGNVTIIAKIASKSNSSGVRVGLMFKTNTGASSQFYAIVQQGNDNIVGKIYRETDNNTANILQFTNAPANVWLKIKKVGDVIQAYYSTAANPSISNDTGWIEDLSGTGLPLPPNITWGSSFVVGATISNTSTISPAEVVFTNLQIDDNGNISNL